MRGFVKDGLMPRDTYGDWCVPPEKPELIHSEDPARKTEGRFLGTAYYIRMLGLMERYAKLTNHARRRPGVRAAGRFHDALSTSTTSTPSPASTPTARRPPRILPLAFDIAAPEGAQAPCSTTSSARSTMESNGHVGVGLIGAQWLMRTLSDNGRADLALPIATQKTYPGWGYMIEKGATTIWELWNGDTADPAMNSGNHVMQIGDLSVWLYEYLAGIRPDPAYPAFARFSIKPTPVDGLDWVKASRRTPHGEIRVHWRKTPGKFELDASIPPNTSATILLPGPLATLPPGLRPLPPQDGRSAYQAVSGDYSLAVSTSARPSAQ